MAYFADVVDQVWAPWCGPQQRLAEAVSEAEWGQPAVPQFWRLRGDHEDSERPSIEIDGSGNKPRESLFSTLGAWALLHTDPDASEEFSVRGLAAAVDEEGRVACTVTMFYALASAGWIDGSAQCVPPLQAAKERSGPIATRWIAAQVMADASMGTDQMAEVVDGTSDSPSRWARSRSLDRGCSADM